MAEQGAGELDAGWDLVFDGVGVTIGETEALRCASGRADAGRLLALMGPSGAGKTTLLNALARKGPVTAGTISYGGRPWSKSLKRRIAFVEQDDVVFEALTVRQSVTFLARLRLARGMTAEAIAKRVDDTLELLKLSKVADNKVGGALARGISGGERKRLCIAQELLVDPRVMLLDEPTSGLDSSMAHVVTKMLKDLARSTNITIVASIHQPSSQVFHTFDELLLLDKGIVAYRGHTAELGAYFGERLGFPVPAEYNPSDYVMEVAVDGRLAAPETEAKLLADFGKGTVERDPRVGTMGELVESRDARYAQSWLAQWAILMEREWELIKPNLWSWETFILYVGQALLSGLLWYQLGYDEDDIFPRFTAAFGITVPWMFFPLMESLPVLPSGMVHLKKELGVGAYRLSAWYWARTTVSLAPYAFWPILHISIVYWMSNLNPDAGAFFALYLLIMLSIVMYQSNGFFIGASVPPQKLMTVTLLWVTFMFLFTGIFVPVEDTALPWLGWVNPVLYTYFPTVHIIFGIGDRAYDCNDADAGTSFPEVCDAAGNGEIEAEDIYDEFDIKLNPGPAIAVMVGFAMAMRCGAYALLRRDMDSTLKPKEEVAAWDDASDKGAAAITPAGALEMGESKAESQL